MEAQCSAQVLATGCEPPPSYISAVQYDRTVIAYHGTHAAIADAIIDGRASMRESANPYDWLGRGVYLWEWGYERAVHWAVARHGLDDAGVVGAVVQLGHCFDLMDVAFTRSLGDGAEHFVAAASAAGVTVPLNRGPDEDRGGRFFDCALINWWLPMVEASEGRRIQTVRCGFVEGDRIHANAGIRARSHVQIAVRDPRCIVGVFRPTGYSSAASST